jgi:hypothetical protein
MSIAETAFLDAVASYLKNDAAIAAVVDVAEPVSDNELPAVVLSLDSVRRLGGGLGEGSATITRGVLPWTETIDLANPVLPEEPAFRLVSTETLILPHGGLRRKDGTNGALGADDLTVTASVPLPTVTAVDPLAGIVTFDTALPGAGELVVSYFLGQWERSVTKIGGVLRVDVRAAAVGPVADLSDAVAAALLDVPKGKLKGLQKISLTALTSVGLPDALRADSRGRTALFSFDYDHEVNRPDSGGGIIRDIPIATLLKKPD